MTSRRGYFDWNRVAITVLVRKSLLSPPPSTPARAVMQALSALWLSLFVSKSENRILAPSLRGWCSAQRMTMRMIAGGDHTIILLARRKP